MFWNQSINYIIKIVNFLTVKLRFLPLKLLWRWSLQTKWVESSCNELLHSSHGSKLKRNLCWHTDITIFTDYKQAENFSADSRCTLKTYPIKKVCFGYSLFIFLFSGALQEIQNLHLYMRRKCIFSWRGLILCFSLTSVSVNLEGVNLYI